LLLEVENLSVYYDQALILSDVNLRIDSGELVSLVGPNGAGKTTLLRAISGMINKEKEELKFSGSSVRLLGKITYQGERIDHLLSYQIARKGLIHCPERHRPFRGMSVVDNLLAGAFLCRDKVEVKRRLNIVYGLFPVLKERGFQISGTLSGGEQQMLAIGRSFMLQPELLCIDEPSLGLAPQVKKLVFEQIREIQNHGIAILLIEQDVKLSFSISAKNYILSSGRIVAEGSSEDLLKDETVKTSYLGL
jgi:branched-chain amino acid transport system ATP-binding protein